MYQHISTITLIGYVDWK